jgi:hypothetical protein
MRDERKPMNSSQEIREMVERFAIGHPEHWSGRILTILDALNRRIDVLEKKCKWIEAAAQHRIGEDKTGGALF